MSKADSQLLGGLTPEQFLDEYWQQKPLLIRQAFPGFKCPVTPDDLAGLALEDSVESRIIQERDDSENWQLKSGPFSEKDFEQLGHSPWTLLIQQLDAWVPEINALKEQFQFIPNWRIDDIMASFAPVGGSVGPHFDQYDVFLIQATGLRHWQLGQWCDEETNLRDDTPLSILSDFEKTTEWTLEPGDMLYLPPKLAHFGRSQSDDCITLSVGFRAPSNIELIENYSRHILDSIEERFYQDKNLSSMRQCGELKEEDILRLRQLMLEGLLDEKMFSSWLGEYLTSPKNPDILFSESDSPDWDELCTLINEGSTLQKNEGSRFTYAQQGDEITLFSDGQALPLELFDFTFVQYLCNSLRLDAHTIVELCSTISSQQCVCDLVRNGSLVVETVE